MSNEEIIEKLKICEGNFNELIGELYFLNLNTVNYFKMRLNVPAAYKDDFMQQAYFALLDAIDAYSSVDSKKLHFISFYKRCLIHHYFLLKLKMFYSVSLSRTSYELLKSSDKLYYVENLDDNTVSFSDFNRELCDIEDGILKQMLWGFVEQNLTEKNSYIVKEKFINQRTYKDISIELGIGEERVRQRTIRSLKKLKNVESIRHLAKDFFYINPS